MKTILVSRFSAFGDVVISVNVIKAVIEQNQDCKIIYLTKKPFPVLFEKIERVEAITPDLNGEHKGFLGLYSLSKELKKLNIDIYIDIHNSLRTRILRFFFSIYGIKNGKIDKGRKEKKALTRRKNKVLKPLKNTAERYADVFRKFGIKVDLSAIKKSEKLVLPLSAKKLLPEKDKKWIGIAPFSMHKQKTYPFEKIKQVIQLLSNKKFQVFIYGGGEKENNLANELVNEFSNVQNLIGQFILKDELTVIEQMDLMFTPDSASLHLTSLTTTKVLSVWGGTHYFAGFAPNHNPNHSIIEIPISELTCRPCSVFGKTACFRDDLACLNMITPQSVVEKIVELVDSRI